MFLWYFKYKEEFLVVFLFTHPLPDLAGQAGKPPYGVFGADQKVIFFVYGKPSSC